MYQTIKRCMMRVIIVPALLLVLVQGSGSVTGAAAQAKDKATSGIPPAGPGLVISGYPMAVTVYDNTQMDVQFTNSVLGQDMTHQFYGNYGEGVYLWATIHGETKVFGPTYAPGGHMVNPFAPVSNVLSGSGTPSDPWLVTTVNDVPGTKLRLTQLTSYVNGAEYVKVQFSVHQMGGTQPVSVVVFHAADLSTGGASEVAYGYFNSHTDGVGDYLGPTTSSATPKMYQQFVPASPVSAHQEDSYDVIWDAIGDVNAAGPGLNSICKVNEPLDVGIGLQWNLDVPASGAVAVGDTMFFGPHTDLTGSFSDVAFGSYPYEYVYYLGTHDIVNGYADGTFRPYNNATRGQITKMVVLSAGWQINTTGGPHFSDVPVDSTFYKYIETAYNLHVIYGYDDGTFQPGNNVTRAQISKILYPVATGDLAR